MPAGFWKSLNLGQKLILANLLIIVVMVAVYSVMDLVDKKSFRFTSGKGENVGWRDIAYFTIITHTTVGYGDIVPAQWWSRLAVAFHVLLVWIFNLGIIWISLSQEIKESVNEATINAVEQSRRIMGIRVPWSKRADILTAIRE